jgi:3-methylcrotonyl-CoA carboxylase alpha subunit
MPPRWLLAEVAREFADDVAEYDLLGFRLNGPAKWDVKISDGQQEYVADLCAAPTDAALELINLDVVDDAIFATMQGRTWRFEPAASRGTGASHRLRDGEIEAPMPGKVTVVEVSQDEKVVKGQRLLTLEAMKMEHALTAPFDGIVAELNAREGAQVSEGQLLVRIEEADPSPRT